MAYSVNWITRVVSVPTSDLTLVSGTHYSLDMFDFLAEIRRLEWEFTDGLWAPAMLDHSNTRFDFAGSNYAAFDELINGYTWQITGSATRVDLLNSNNNLIDQLIPTGISVVPSNSTGLTSFVSKDIANVKYLIESLRPHHTGQGDIFYWDPLAGNDLLDGSTPGQAVATFAQAQTLASDGNHDIIVALSSGVGQTVVDETLEITKNYLFLRGPGRDFRIKPTSTTAPTIKIDAVGVEVASMIVDTADSGGQSAISVVDGADFFSLDHLWSRDAQDDVVEITGSVVYGRIDGCFFSHPLEDGIHINGDVRHTRITNTELDACGVNGVLIEGTTARNNIIGNGVKIYDSGAYGVRINSPATRNFIDSDVSLYDNASGNILDGGTDTVIENKVERIHKRLGLDSSDPITDTPSGISSQSGDIDITRTGDGETSSTLTHQ